MTLPTITNPLWTEQYPRPAALPAAAPPDQVDVAIIGGGYTGLSAALHLAKSGASVAVLERETIGWGASSRNGGIVSPGLKQSIRKIFRMYGPEMGREFWQAGLDAIHLLDSLVREESIDCDWQPTGYAEMACKPAHFYHFQQQARWLKDHLGYEARAIPPSDLAGEIGSTFYHGALVGEVGGTLHPAKYVFGLARASARHGAILCEDAAVTALTRQASGFEVRTVRGVTRAKEVLAATNGYTDHLIPRLKPGVFAVGSYIITTEPLPADLQQKLDPQRRGFWDSKNFLNYWRLTPDGRMLWGGRNNLDPNLDLKASADNLRKQMLRVFPDLRDTAITHSWTGRMGITFDLMPHIGRVEGVLYALGYCGHGVAVSTYLGREVARLIGGEITRSPFAEIPHPAWFFYRKEPWFLPVAAAWYRVVDAVL